MHYESLPLIPMLIGLAGGLALFLRGKTMMSNAMRAIAGSRVKIIIGRLAHNRFSAFATPGFVCAPDLLPAPLGSRSFNGFILYPT